MERQEEQSKKTKCICMKQTGDYLIIHSQGLKFIHFGNVCMSPKCFGFLFDLYAMKIFYFQK